MGFCWISPSSWGERCNSFFTSEYGHRQLAELWGSSSLFLLLGTVFIMFGINNVENLLVINCLLQVTLFFILPFLILVLSNYCKKHLFPGSPNRLFLAKCYAGENPCLGNFT